MNIYTIPKDIIREAMFGEPSYVDNDIYLKVSKAALVAMAKRKLSRNPTELEKQDCVNEVYIQLNEL